MWAGDPCAAWLASASLADVSPRALSHRFFAISQALATISLRRAAQRWLTEVRLEQTNILAEHNLCLSTCFEKAYEDSV